ncbi:MAG: hypothetical protein ABH814_00770 [bacterium]
MKFAIAIVAIIFAVNTGWYFLAGPNIPWRWSIILCLIGFSFIWRVRPKYIIMAGTATFAAAYLGILVKNYQASEKIADLGYFIIAFGIVKKFFTASRRKPSLE